MLSTYCQHCGGKNEYRLTKPKFCSSCGQPLSSDFVQAKSKELEKPSINKKINVEVHDEDGTDIYEVPDISNLEYEIEVSNSSFKLGSIMPSPEPREAPKKQSKKRGRPRKNG